MKFSIVDDSSTMRRILKNSLKRIDFEDMLEAANGKDDIVEALKNGVNNYIVKPFTPETLKEKVEAVLK